MEIPSYRRHSSGQARVTIRGRDRLLGPYGSRESKSKYRELIQVYLDQRFEQSEEVKSDGTIGSCLVAFLDHAKVYYRMSREYRNLVYSLRSLDAIADLPAVELGPRAFKEIQAALVRKQAVSRQYANKIMGHVRRFIKWCVSEELIPAGCYEGIRCVEPLKAGRTKLKEAGPIKPVDAVNVKAAIAVMPQVLVDMVRLQQLTAARPAEICRITPNMIDRSEPVWQVHFSKHKTAWRGKGRIVYVGKKGQAILKKYLKRDPDAACFSPREAIEQRRRAAAADRETPINQGNRRGYGKRSRAGQNNYQVADAYSTDTYRRAIEYACKKAGVPGWSPNQLRHSRSTEIRKAFGLEASQVILGHARCDVTQVYAEANQELAIEITKKIG